MSSFEYEASVPPNAILPSTWRTVDPAVPWAPSPPPQTPVSPAVDGEDKTPSMRGGDQVRSAARVHKRSQDRATAEAKAGDVLKRRSRLSVFYWIDRLRSAWRTTAKEDKSSLPEQPKTRQVMPADWKAYGYWARPKLGDMTVRNATPPPFRRHLTPPQVEAVMRSLTSPDGSWHPENWIPRLEHPALPPRPELWPTPPPSPPSVPPPLADELALNPFLEHRRTGLPPVDLDLRRPALWVYLGEPPGAAPLVESPEAPKLHPLLELDGPNGAQPATHPGVGALNAGALADDPAPCVRWPFIVLAHHPALPVSVADVLEALHENFRQCLTEEEVAALSPARQDQLFRTYWSRVECYGGGGTDGLRRVDYLGDRYMFRGLEPAPSGDGFMIYFGPPR